MAARIQHLGPINLAVIEEFQTESERKEYLNAPYRDLEDVLKCWNMQFTRSTAKRAPSSKRSTRLASGACSGVDGLVLNQPAAPLPTAIDGSPSNSGAAAPILDDDSPAAVGGVVQVSWSHSRQDTTRPRPGKLGRGLLLTRVLTRVLARVLARVLVRVLVRVLARVLA